MSTRAYRLAQSARPRRRRRYGVLAACVSSGALLGLFHNRAAEQGGMDPVTAAARTVTAPIVSAVHSVGSWTSRQFTWLAQGHSLDAENRRLKQENAQLREQIARLSEAEATASRLRAHLGFAQPAPEQRIAASVIALRPRTGFETLVINRGTRHGVHRRSVVVTPGGIVGQVYDAGPTSAAVMLLTDAGSAVGARVQRPDSRAVGVCKGTGASELALTYLEQDASVRIGDTIVSSGLGGPRGTFPPGLAIGVVTRVDASGNTGKTVIVEPSVDFGRLEEVYVLR